MIQKIFNLIASSSERSRKIIAGIAVALAGIMLFFAWTAGVSARLPLLGSGFDASSAIAQTQPGEAPIASNATAISPMKGLIESFHDLAGLFHGEYPAIPDSSSAASFTPARPVDDLFNKISDEPTSVTSTKQSEASTTTPDDLPLADELPGL